MSVGTSIKKLHRIRNIYTAETANEKLELMRALQDALIRKAAQLKLFHVSLCFIKAFPDDLVHHRLATEALGEFVKRVRLLDSEERAALAETGLEATLIHYRYSYPVALWLARHCPGSVEIDWEEFQDPGRLDELLGQLVFPGESDYYTSGSVSERQWIGLAKGDRAISDFRWLIIQLRKRRTEARVLAAMYDAADVPLRWRLDRKFAKGRNTMPVTGIVARKHGLRKLKGSAKHEMERPFRKFHLLDRSDGVRAVSGAVAALAVRHRETYHFNHANPGEVYLADVGRGVNILVFGLQPEYRFTLETTMGYLIVANGMPVGYGGASALFNQANTGINIFEEYRGGEAPYLWIEVLRTYHHLFGCTRFVINPYQFGAGNSEALKSGAFWFYYRLGFRPVDPDIARLAVEETAKVKTRKDYRSDINTLKRFTHCDMHLKLSGARQSEFFREEWLELCAAGASGVLAGQTAVERRQAARQAAANLESVLRDGPGPGWTKSERQAFLLQAPTMSLVDDIESWSSTEKGDLVRLMKSKGGDLECDYVERLCAHEPLRLGLARYCRGRAG
jgi:hypothetical protein